MVTLAGPQIRQLRSMANSLKPVVTVGKGNVTMDVVDRADEALDAHELIKCSLLDTSDLTVREAADELAQRAGAQVVQVIGHKFVLYRETRRKDVKKIQLV